MKEERKKVLVVDYGMGNIGSIVNMLKYIGVETSVVTRPSELRDCSGIILPGVGHFDRAMKNLRETGLATALSDVRNLGNTPILGICLGMQIMCKSSEEGAAYGLGFFDASVRRFQLPEELKLKVPHMGWNEVEVKREGTILGSSNSSRARYYFVHTYFVSCVNSEDVAGTSIHGIEFTSAIEQGSVMGVQFHPEKSHRFGLELFRRFLGDER